MDEQEKAVKVKDHDEYIFPEKVKAKKVLRAIKPHI